MLKAIPRTVLFGADGDGVVDVLLPGVLVAVAAAAGLLLSALVSLLDGPKAATAVGVLAVATVGTLGAVSLFRAVTAAYGGDGYLEGLVPITWLALAGAALWLVGLVVRGDGLGEGPVVATVAIGLAMAVVAGSIAYLVGSMLRSFVAVVRG